MSLVREEEVEEKKEILSQVCSQTNQEVKSFVLLFLQEKALFLVSATGDKPAPVSDSQPTGVFALLYHLF